ncbi:MAG TPA: GDP-mannose 4,6-dehydratase [Acidimicrobiales bacterium]|nr:GDP-mannose 4,6-dehydratase [Acidimicrobiales bacterium]
MASTYLVTGGGGFIGSHVVEALLARGEHVIVLDTLSTGQLPNLDAVRDHPRLRFVQGSVFDELLIDELVHQCDVIVHLAAAVGVRLIMDEPLRSLNTNIRGAEIVIEAALHYRRKILLASTSEIYGKNSDVPLSETSDCILGPATVPRWAYSTAKAVAEILAFAYHEERNLPTIVVRFFNTVGPRQSPAYGMVIPRLVRQALANEPLTVYGDGSQTRCFCHVNDVVDAIISLLQHPDAVGEMFNIGSDEEVNILELSQRIIRITESSSEIHLVPFERAFQSNFEDIPRRVPDTTKIRTLTGWQPTRLLDTILEETIARTRDELRHAGAR